MSHNEIDLRTAGKSTVGPARDPLHLGVLIGTLALTPLCASKPCLMALFTVSLLSSGALDGWMWM